MAIVEHSEKQVARREVDPAPFDRRSLNVPNAITLSRLLLAVVLFVLIDLEGWWRMAAAVFVIAAATDFLDGYLARTYGQVTVLGRIMDPFVDKIIICGSFIFLLGKESQGVAGATGSGVTAWMTFLIIAREMFVSSLRAFLEKRGQDFSARWSGKVKMLMQCVAVPVCLLSLSGEFRQSLSAVMAWSDFISLRDVLLWVTVGVTVYSGVEYTIRGFRMTSRPAASGDE